MLRENLLFMIIKIIKAGILFTLDSLTLNLFDNHIRQIIYLIIKNKRTKRYINILYTQMQ